MARDSDLEHEKGAEETVQERRAVQLNLARAEKGDGRDGSALPKTDDEAVGEFLEVKELRQGLHQRHIQMIALAGTSEYSLLP